MASTSAPTIPSLKQSFLTTQTTLLAQPLAPSRSWQAANDASDEPLPERAVDDALFALNHSIQQHCHRLYAPQANRNIAEQINKTYTEDAQRRLGPGFDDAGEGALGREMDLTDHDTIEALPETWISEKDINDYPMEAKLYADAVRRLSELDEQRKQLRDQVARLNRLKSVVQPLQTGESGAGIQENLLTRNGPVEKELERMRFLLARVGGRVNALPDGGGSDAASQAVPVTSSDSLGLARKRRIDQFLADAKVFPS
ncbi:hypothetical protein G7Z17_g12907 [Cylindrodendrum hubeiense]|uniref:Kinetochore protein fta4 n=1 Tax=Cylindrodendrum hubeiense TaxID=595255 RepID=A0A9P5L527_9HYPO|nr:hypothetical protein G7Z17_g12907 [Cylindrodendrum hubeiense]